MIVGISGKLQSGKSTIGKIIQYLIAIEKAQFSFIPNEEDYKRWEINKHNERSNWQIKMFADKLKDIVCLLIGCTREQLEDYEFKNKELGEEWWFWNTYSDWKGKGKIDLELFPYIGNKDKYPSEPIKLTPRNLMQLIGTDCGRQIIHPDIWINSLFSDYKPLVPSIRRGRMTALAAKNAIKESIFNPIYPNWIITDVRFPNEVKAIKDRSGIVIRINQPIKDGESYYNLNMGMNHKSETALDDYVDFDYVLSNKGTIDDLIEKVKQILIKEKII